MKKTLIALLLACMLALPFQAALAQAAPALTVFDAGDFTLTLDPDTPVQMAEKAESTVYFTLYPAYLALGDTSANFNCVWNSQAQDIESWNSLQLNLLQSSLYPQFLSAYAQQNLTLTDFHVKDMRVSTLDGKPALMYTLESTLDLSGLGEGYAGTQVSLIQRLVIASGDFGTYTFTGTATTEELLSAYIDPMFDSLRWK